jgi:hypothetical protein
MALTVLSVAYPFAPVGPAAVGGAEQILSRLDRALVEAGHASLVLAGEGSEVAGELIAMPAECGCIDEAARERAWMRHRRAIAQALARHRVDLVHMHGVDFHAYLPATSLPILVTLHLPLACYPAEVLRRAPRNLRFHCV